MLRRDKPLHRCQSLCWRSIRCDDLSDGQVMDKSAANVGYNLRKLRVQRNLVIRSLAEMSGLSVNTLSLIENGKSSPSVKSLLALSESLQAPITSFFDSPCEQDRVVYVRRDQRPMASLPYGKLENLGANLVINSVEPYMLTLEPHSLSHSQDVVHTGFEFV